MTYLRNLWRTELAAMVSLVLFAAGLTGGLGMLGSLYAPAPAPFEAAIIMFSLTLLIGVGPVTVFFAPIYAFLKTKRAASFIVAGIVGVLPGIALFLFDRNSGQMLGPYAILAGILVPAFTHAIMKRRNNEL